MEFFSLMNTIYTNQVFISISAIFCGDLSTTVPQDGRLKRAGYSNMKLVTQRLAFGRIKFLDFDVYDAIVLRIRGDGRSRRRREQQGGSKRLERTQGATSRRQRQRSV